MDFGAIFLLFVVALMVALFVAQPFRERQRNGTLSKEERQLSSQLAERDRVINALQELDFDNTLGKIPGEDYAVQRAGLLKQGTEVLRKIDAFAPASQPQQAQGPDLAEDRLEAAIAARRADAAVGVQAGPAVTSDDDLEELIASRRGMRTEKSAGFCPNCGRPVLHSDRFCPNCGRPLK